MAPTPRVQQKTSSAASQTASTKVPQQELGDLHSLRTYLEYEYGTDIGIALSGDAANRRGMNTALKHGAAALEQRDHDVPWRQALGKNAYEFLRRQHTLLWPLAGDDAPAPPWLLADEVAAMMEGQARRTDMETHSLHQVHKQEHAHVWMAVQEKLRSLLLNLVWAPSITVLPSTLQRDIDTAVADPTPYKAEALRSILTYRHWSTDKRLYAHPLTWRDILAVALVHDDPVLRQAAEETCTLLSEVFGAQEYEPRLIRRTWSLEHCAPIQQRAQRVREARDAIPAYNLLDESADVLYRSPPLWPLAASMAPAEQEHREFSMPAWHCSSAEIRDALVWDSEDDGVSDDSNTETSDEVFSISSTSEASSSSSETSLSSSEEDSSSSSSSPYSSDASMPSSSPPITMRRLRKRPPPRRVSGGPSKKPRSSHAPIYPPTITRTQSR
ncbi:hypothetical protein Malapachy_2901 [Malassezia pachydermatis]|uniref:Uncharacterized protein n=1 Tax=Malassezia pachydermatis TaxID=77020 RepID=A0A0M8MRS6_9BASI|nr:hypothetical protein Malapachy_2901 [Malassezia pachydermatis]KOS12480.1 hypothetical protein Malapachy_2901 [Malassezia pachydermatis]